MKIAYAKLGRSIPLLDENVSSVGGDVEVLRLLKRLVAEGHEVHLVGRNRVDGEIPGVVNHWAPGGCFGNVPPAGRSRDSAEYKAFYEALCSGTSKLPDMDHWLVWLGQNGSSLHPVPAVQRGLLGNYTEPLVSLVNYGYPVVHMMNHLGVTPTWLCPDPRNTIKFRDLWRMDQRTCLAQYDCKKNNTFFDERDNTLRPGEMRYKYSGIEMLAVDFDNPEVGIASAPSIPFGALVNEGPSDCKLPRRELYDEWVTKNLNVEVPTFGHWTDEGMRYIGRRVRSVEQRQVLETLSEWRSTITFPASGSGWATAKPWECFAVGCVCFKHPAYDDQGHIYSQERMGARLYEFLTPRTPAELLDRVQSLDAATWREYSSMQWDYLQASRKRLDDGYASVKKALNAC